MVYIVLNFDGVLYNSKSLNRQKTLNLELIQSIFEYQITHTCKLAIITDSSTKLVNQTLSQSKLEFDFILSHEKGVNKVQKFSDMAKYWGVSLLDIYCFTANLDEIQSFNFLNPLKLFGCTWNTPTKLPQMLEYLPQTQVLTKAEYLPLVLPVISAELVENSKFLGDHQAWALRDGRQIVVGAVVIDAAGQALIQKRSASRRLFPNCWDISAGGHLESGETIFQALKRELLEETGLELDQILDLILIYDWEIEGDNLDPNNNKLRREFNFIISCKGDLDNIKIEKDKVSEIRWIGFDELNLLKQDHTNDNFVYRIVSKALEYNRNSI